MKHLTWLQKKRLKRALKIMRETEVIKYEEVRDFFHMDPSHIEKGESIPSLSTIFAYCEIFKRCPGWTLILFCQVDRGKISENEFNELIQNWHKYETIAEWKIDEFLKMANESTVWQPNQKKVLQQKI